MSSITDLALATRTSAADVVQRHKKLASFRLYDVLVPCKALCERALRDPQELAELERLFAAQPVAGNRRYVEKGSDIYILVSRFVFGEANRNNAWRYACALRQAADMQISSEQLGEHLRRRGGVNGLFFKRPLERREVMVSCLRLDRPVRASRDEPFTLTLRWTDENVFTVIEQETRI